MKAYYKVDHGGIEFVTEVDTYDVGEAVKIIRDRFDIPDDKHVFVRMPRKQPTGVFKEASHHVLTPADMLTIQDAITSDGEAAGVLALWEIILGLPLPTHKGQVDPSDYAISEAQWEEIAGYMVHDPRVQHPSYEGIPGFTMVNTGPSSYESEDA